jgi:hypothetical protein
MALPQTRLQVCLSDSDQFLTGLLATLWTAIYMPSVHKNPSTLISAFE